MSRSGGITADASVQRAFLAADVGPIASQTTFQNITGLSFALGASATEVWLVRMYLLVSAANATMDLKLKFATLPAGAGIRWGAEGALVNEMGAFGARVPATSPVAILTGGDTLAVSTFAGTSAVVIAAIVFGGGTAGTIQPQYAQNTSDPGNLSILARSLLRAEKFAA